MYYNLKKYHEAIECYNKASEINLNRAEVWNNMGEAYTRLKDYKKALDMSKKVLKDFNTAKNYTIVADIYYLMNNYDESAKYYERAYAKNKDVKVLINLSNIFYTYLNKKKEAISYLETYHRQYSCNKEVCQTLLRYYQENQNIDGMISISNTLF